MERIKNSLEDADKIKQAAQIISQGALVAFPTETVYGLGADALNAGASEKIYAAKGRPSDNPLIVHIAEFSALDKIVTVIPKQARALSEAFWPGPLTLVLPKNENVPDETTGGLDTVAIRMPNHPVALALIKESGGYIAAPSANTSGRPSPTLAEHVFADLNGKIPLILDGGPVGIGIESTILDLTEEVPMILRPGFITKEMIEKVIGEVKVDPGIIDSDSSVKPKAPGMKYKHYAPQADLVLISGEAKMVVERICTLTTENIAQGKRVGIICTDETYACYHQGTVVSIGSRKDENAIARHLYKILREFDDMDVEIIYSESFSTPRIGQAIMNRLLKAAGHQVISV